MGYDTIIGITHLCGIKKLLVITLLILTAQLSAVAFNPAGMCLVAITDTNNERISGATIELVGTNKVFYSNINGYCYIPKYLLVKTQKIVINSISYKTLHLSTQDLNSRIILKSR